MKILDDNTYVPETEPEIKEYAERESNENYAAYYQHERPIDQLKHNILTGKFAELKLAYCFNKTGHKINSGVRLFDNHPDYGTDLIVDDIKIQVKSSVGMHFNIRSTNMLRQLKEYDGMILLYSLPRDKTYVITKDILKYRVYAGKYSAAFIYVDDLKEFSF